MFRLPINVTRIGRRPLAAQATRDSSIDVPPGAPGGRARDPNIDVRGPGALAIFSLWREKKSQRRPAAMDSHPGAAVDFQLTSAGTLEDYLLPQRKHRKYCGNLYAITRLLLLCTFCPEHFYEIS